MKEPPPQKKGIDLLDRSVTNLDKFMEEHNRKVLDTKTSISGHLAWEDQRPDEVPIVIEPENKYSKPYTLRKDLCLMV